MASRAKSYVWLAVLTAVTVGVVCAVPLVVRGRALFLKVKESAESTSSVGVPVTAHAVIEEMARSAGVIFAGQVVAVRRPAGLGEAAVDGIVEVDFRVDQAVRGPETGAIYTLREWSGLWEASGGRERYQVGQRLLVFFYEPDPHGLSSLVDGLDGAIPLRGGGFAPGPDDDTTTAAQWLVDLRWVQARALVRNALVMLPARRLVSPKPIRGFMPEEETGLSEMEIESALVRRIPLPEPFQTLTPAPVETEPLEQVLMLCQQAMRRVDVTR